MDFGFDFLAVNFFVVSRVGELEDEGVGVIEGGTGSCSGDCGG